MPKYEGHADFKEAKARTDALAASRANLVAKEVQLAQADELLGTSSRKLSVTKAEEAQARGEAVQAAERERAVAGQNLKSLKVENETIQRNTELRRRNNQVRREAAQGQGGYASAFRGANDPLFGQAAQIAPTGGLPSQYKLRQELGVGTQRAKRLIDALGAGIDRGTAGTAADRPLTRQQASIAGLARADYEYEQARRNYTNVLRRKTATDDDRTAALSARKAAEDARAKARVEASAAEGEAQARTANAAVIRRESERRERTSAATFGGGNALVRHPDLYGQGLGVNQSAADILGGDARYRTNRLGVPDPQRSDALRQLREGGAVGGRLGGGNADYDRHATEVMRDQAHAIGDVNTAQKLHLSLLGEEAQAYHLGLVTSANQAYVEQAGALTRVSGATRAYGVNAFTTSQQLRARGALTSEFIAAAARGETTMKELGYQTVVTAAKFGGWTAAATALYAGANAIHQVGTGAIQASSGVHTLQRVINDVNGDTAQKTFGDLAQRFNVPLDIAVDAVYRMGQVFHSQADATKAAEAALYSYKTGEVDVASSTQNLIAITRGFGLSSTELVNVYDQINQAQNTFGIRISDTEAGLAKAAGTYRNAGGDLNYLLGLFVAIQKATGRSGQEIGTGIARGVNQIRKPTNQAELAGQGVEVDPNNFQKTLKSALQAARRPGSDLQQIAAGLFGNQYARLIAPVLADQTTLNRALKDTSPAASQNSAQRELAKVLKQVDEQIQSIGINLQRLGGALASSGALNIFGLLLKTLNTTLDTAVDLVNVFNHLVPPDIRPVVTGVVELAAAIALIRRTGGLNGIVAEKLPFLANPDRRLQVRATAGLRAQNAALNNYTEGLANVGLQRGVAAEEARRGYLNNEATYAAREQAGTLPLVGTRQRERIEQQRIALANEAVTAEQESTAITKRINNAREIQLRTANDLALIQGAEARDVPQLLRERAIPVPAELQAPSTKGITFVEGAAAGEIGGRLAAGTSPAVADRVAAEEALRQGTEQTTRAIEGLHGSMDFTDLRDKITEPLEKAKEKLAETGTVAEAAGAGNVAGGVGDRAGAAGAAEKATARTAAARGELSLADRALTEAQYGLAAFQVALEEHAATIARFGLVGTGVAAAASASAGAGIRAAGALKGADAAISGAAAGLRGGAAAFLSALGPLDLLIGAFVAYTFIKPKVDAREKRIRDAVTELTRRPTSALDRRGQRQDIADEAASLSKNPGVGGTVKDSVADFLHPVYWFTHAGRSYSQDQRNRAAQELRQRGEELRKEALQQEGELSTGAPLTNAYTGQVRTRIRENAQDAIAGIKSLSDFNKDVRTRLGEVRNSTNIGPKNRVATQRYIREVQRATIGQLDPHAFGARFDNASSAELTQDFQNTAARLKSTSGPRRSFDFQELSAEYTRIRDRLRQDVSPKGIAALNAARDAYFQAIADGVQSEVTSGLPLASTEGARRGVFNRAREMQQRATLNARNALARSRNRGRQLVSQVNRDRDTADLFGQLTPNLADGARGLGGLGTLGQIPVTQVGYSPTSIRAARRQKESKLRRDIAALKAAELANSQAVKEYADAVARDRVAIAALRDQDYQDRSQGRQIRLGLRQSRTRSQSAQAAEAVNTASQETRDALNTYGKGSREYQQALTNLNQAQQQQGDAVLAMVEAQNALLVANAGNDPAAQAAAGVTAARNTLGALRRQGADPAAIVQAQAGVKQAQNAADAQAKQTRDNIAQLRGQLAIAQAGDDPVAAARASIKVAREAAGRAKDEGERLQAQIDLITSERELERALREQTQARYQYLATLTTDPVKQARIQRDAARRAVKGTHGTERYNALAQRNTAEQNYIQTRVTEGEDTIQFNLEMGRITTDVAIRQYRSLLKSHHLAKATRRDLLLKIHDLEKGDGEITADLSPGNINLPTAYEIRRAVTGAAKGIQVTQQFNTNVTVHKSADAAEVGHHLDRHIHGAGKSILRAAGR